MPVPQSTTAHAELLDRRFSKIFDGAYKNPMKSAPRSLRCKPRVKAQTKKDE